MQSDDETLAGDVIVFAFQGFCRLTSSSPPLMALIVPQLRFSDRFCDRLVMKQRFFPQMPAHQQRMGHLDTSSDSASRQ
jgi:hypothetical protein